MQTQIYKLWGEHVWFKLNFTSFEYNPIILVSVSFRVMFPITLDQNSDTKYVTFEKTNYSSGSLQLFMGTS